MGDLYQFVRKKDGPVIVKRRRNGPEESRPGQKPSPGGAPGRSAGSYRDEPVPATRGAHGVRSEPNRGPASGQNARQRYQRRAHHPVILQIIPDLGAGGAEQTTIDIAEAVAQAGGTALVASRGGFRENELAAVGGLLVPIPVHTKNAYSMAANILRLSHLVDYYNVDVMHVRSRAPAWSALAAAALTGRPLVATYHGTYKSKTALKRFYNSGMVRGDAVIANSRFIAKHLVATHGIDGRRIDVIPRGIDMTRFDPDAIDPARVETLRTGWRVSGPVGPGVPGKTRVILLPGRLTAWKGQGVLVEALARLEAHSPFKGQWIAVLLGDPQGRDRYRTALEDRLKALNLQERVLIQGHCRDMPAAYLAADVIVSPSLEPEAFGRVPVEAQAMGRPVIATDHGGAQETILVSPREGRQAPTGWRVPPRDAKALALALDEVLSLDGNAWAAMGERGRAHVRQPYALTTMKADTLAVYDRLMQGHRR